MKVTCREGEQFKFGVKPAGGSLSFDVEKISDDITEPAGLIGQFLSEVSYEIDEEHNIITKSVNGCEITWLDILQKLHCDIYGTPRII